MPPFKSPTPNLGCRRCFNMFCFTAFHSRVTRARPLTARLTRRCSYNGMRWWKKKSM
jgi:hypothetical protein